MFILYRTDLAIEEFMSPCLGSCLIFCWTVLWFFIYYLAHTSLQVHPSHFRLNTGGLLEAFWSKIHFQKSASRCFNNFGHYFGNPAFRTESLPLPNFIPDYQICSLDSLPDLSLSYLLDSDQKMSFRSMTLVLIC